MNTDWRNFLSARAARREHRWRMNARRSGRTGIMSGAPGATHPTFSASKLTDSSGGITATDTGLAPASTQFIFNEKIAQEPGFNRS